MSHPPLTRTTGTGQVIKAHSGFFTVINRDGSQVICRAAGRLTKLKHTQDALAIGDFVRYELVYSEGYAEGRIIEVLPRGRVLARKDPIIATKEQEIQQVIIANLDLVVFVFACAEPAFTPRLLDRYLVGAEAQQLPVLICANKTDIISSEEARRLFRDYEHIGYPVIYTSAATGEGVDTLQAALHGKLSVLTGKSGVGKSSLLNRLKPGLDAEVGALSELLGKGRHTTVVPQLFQLDSDSWIADTPGLRAYAVWDVEAEELDAYYREIAPLVGRCDFSDCTHLHEPGCEVKRQVETGHISAARYDSYRRLRKELSRQRKW